MKVLVLTVSDRASAGIYEDASGPAVEAALLAAHPDIQVVREIVPDEADRILETFGCNLQMDVILTTGGTGLSTRDVTPDATSTFCDKTVPGIAEALRAASFLQTKNAVFSRATAGIKESTLIVNLPGSVRGAGFCAEFLAPMLPHCLKMMRGEGH